MMWLQDLSQLMWKCFFLPLSYVATVVFNSPEAKMTVTKLDKTPLHISSLN